MTLESGGTKQLRLMRSMNNNNNPARRRRLKILRLKYTCESNNRADDDGKKIEGEANNKNKDYAITTAAYRREGRRDDDCQKAIISLSSRNETKQQVVSSSGFEEEEEEDIHSNNNNNKGKRRVSYGWVSVIGRRREMEDAVTVQLGFLTNPIINQDYDFFGVYDGHGGRHVAEACKHTLHSLIAQEVMLELATNTAVSNHNHNHIHIHATTTLSPHHQEYWDRVMQLCFHRMDQQVVHHRMMGSTAVVALLARDHLVVANCGDSRAVLSRAGAAVPLSSDHKPDRADELERVETAGGRVINWNGHRVLGVLATSRSIGDEYLKPFIISKPEVRVEKRSEEDEFLILASDGLWDVMSNEVACQIARRCLTGRMTRKPREVGVVAERGGAADEAAIVLAELAMARGSQDNVTVIVVALNK